MRNASTYNPKAREMRLCSVGLPNFAPRGRCIRSIKKAPKMHPTGRHPIRDEQQPRPMATQPPFRNSSTTSIPLSATPSRHRSQPSSFRPPKETMGCSLREEKSPSSVPAFAECQPPKHNANDLGNTVNKAANWHTRMPIVGRRRTLVGDAMRKRRTT